MISLKILKANVYVHEQQGFTYVLNTLGEHF